MVSRRNLLGVAGATLAAVAGPIFPAALAAPNDYKRPLKGHKAPPLEEIKVGLIGVGNRGYTAVQRLTRIPNLTLVAVCDLLEDRTRRVAAELKERKYNPDTKQYFGSPTAYRAMNDLALDVVYICTPWTDHTPMALDAMRKGKHALVEVPICTTTEEGYELIETAEKTKLHCMMLENVCYGRAEMAVRNMIKAGLFGTIVHVEGAYIDYISPSIFDDRSKSPFRWRLNQKAHRNGNLYPTHGLGPASKYLDITEGDELAELVSMSSIQAGLTEYALEHYGADSLEYRSRYLCGDMNLTLLKTRNGKTILLEYNTTNPRPYTRLNVVTGTKGTFEGFPDRLYLYDPSKPEGPMDYDPEMTEKYIQNYSPPVWKGKTPEKRGHEAFDWIMDQQWVSNLRSGQPMDISVYESVLWSIVSPLSEESIRRGHAPVKFPKI